MSVILLVCHSERSEESAQARPYHAWILRCAANERGWSTAPVLQAPRPRPSASARQTPYDVHQHQTTQRMPVGPVFQNFMRWAGRRWAALGLLIFSGACGANAADWPEYLGGPTR